MKYVPFLLVSLLPLQNIYLGKLPSLGGGLNALNILFFLSFLYAINCQKKTSPDNSTHRMIGIMVCSYAFSFFWGSLRSGFDPNNVSTFKDLLLPYLLFYIVYRSIDSLSVARKFFYATIVPLPYMFKVFYTNLSWMGFSGYKDKLRYNNGTFMELGSNEIAAFYAAYTFVILAVAFKEKNKYILWGLYSVSILNIYSIVYAFSRSAYLSSLIAVVVLCFLCGKIKQLILCTVFFILLIILGVKVIPNATFERFNSSFVDESELDESAQKRLVLWTVARDKFSENPMFGIGYHNFIKENPYHMDTHNLYLRTLAEGGLLGFTILITFFVHSLRRGIQLYRIATEPFLKALASGFIACMVAMIVGNFFGDRFSYYPLISYFFVYLAIVVKGIEMSRKGGGDVTYAHSTSYK